MKHSIIIMVFLPFLSEFNCTGIGELKGGGGEGEGGGGGKGGGGKGAGGGGSD